MDVNYTYFDAHFAIYIYNVICQLLYLNKKNWVKVVKMAGDRGWRTLKVTLSILDFNNKAMRRLLRVLSKEEKK